MGVMGNQVVIQTDIMYYINNNNFNELESKNLYDKHSVKIFWDCVCYFWGTL